MYLALCRPFDDRIFFDQHASTSPPGGAIQGGPLSTARYPDRALAGRVNHLLIPPHTYAEVEEACQGVNRLGLQGLMVLPSCFPMAHSLLDAGRKLSVLVDFPLGGSLLQTKGVAATHVAGQSRLVVVVLNPAHYLSGNLGEMVGEVTALAGVNHGVGVMLELGYLAAEQRTEVLSALRNVASVMGGFYPHIGLTRHLPQPDDIGEIRRYLGGVPIHALSALGRPYAQELVRAGADSVVMTAVAQLNLPDVH